MLLMMMEHARCNDRIEIGRFMGIIVGFVFSGCTHMNDRDSFLV